jgi:diaminohydroxyphosphoribosylaminopyrimidine deaminase/5-amino-6-(5-phosphoribosylamino)uracil reductase
MRLALELAAQGEGRTAPNPAVGAVVVRDGMVVGRGFHPKAGEPHAEIFALREAGEAARGADLYVTLEPCCHTGRTGPCTEAILAAGVVRVYIGCTDPNPQVSGRGCEQLRASGVEVVSGVLVDDCRRLIAPFAKHVRTGLPYVTLKAALTLDGNLATSSGNSQWITGPESRERVHRLRDRSDAVMVGIGTVLADNPRLTTRLPQGGGHDPLRIVIDSRLMTPEEALVVTGPSAAGVLIATTADAPEGKARRLRSLGAEVLRVGDGPSVDLSLLLCDLGARGIQSILLEGGGRLNSAALQAGIVDRCMLFYAPLLLGGRGIGLFAGTGVEFLADAVRLKGLRVEQVGNDVLLEGELPSCSPD